jgi:hypothetical protein
LENK